ETATDVIDSAIDSAEYIAQWQVYTTLCGLVGPLQLTCPPYPPVNSDGTPKLSLWEYVLGILRYNMHSGCKSRDDCDMEGECRCLVDAFSDDDDTSWYKRSAGYDSDTADLCLQGKLVPTGTNDEGYPIFNMNAFPNGT